jgi:hypothetical protein
MTIYIYAAPFVAGNSGEGVYFFDQSFHPYTVIGANGIFQLNNIPPGSYVLSIGPSVELSSTIKVDDKPEIFHVTSDEVEDIGVIPVEP